MIFHKLPGLEDMPAAGKALAWHAAGWISPVRFILPPVKGASGRFVNFGRDFERAAKIPDHAEVVLA